jgi:hypothetical protein
VPQDQPDLLERNTMAQHPGRPRASQDVRAAGKKLNPHVTIGVGTEAYLNVMLAEQFEPFTFSPAGASVYQLGSFGTARKELKALTLTP